MECTYIPAVHNRDTLLLVGTETSSGSTVEFCVGAVTTAEVVATTLRIGPETFLRTRRWKTVADVVLVDIFL